MMQLTAYANKTIAVLGLGISGVATVRALQENNAKLIVWDDRESARNMFMHDKNTDVSSLEEWEWSVIDALILSPGIPLSHPKPHPVVRHAHKHNIPILSDVELLCTATPDVPKIGITGTNGKSTTTALIGHILQESAKAKAKGDVDRRRIEIGGNLGKAVLSMEALTRNDVYVLELSSYQLDLMHRSQLRTALWLNISPDHLDRHGDIDGYIAAKKRIFQNQTAEDIAIVGVDDAYSDAVCRELIAQKRQRVIPISTTQTVGCGVAVRGGILTNNIDHESGVKALSADISDIPTLRGEHNHQNAAAAYAAAYVNGVTHEDIIAAMQNFGGLAHRMEWLGEQGGVHFVNDSKATNADAAAKSLGAYNAIHWIVGGVAKAGGIEGLAPFFPRVKCAYLIGEAAGAFAQTLQGSLEFQHCDTLEVATAQAIENAQAGDVVLLAPACASFDQFPNFEARGNAFKAAVQAAKMPTAHNIMERAHAD